MPDAGKMLEFDELSKIEQKPMVIFAKLDKILVKCAETNLRVHQPFNSSSQ